MTLNGNSQHFPSIQLCAVGSSHGSASDVSAVLSSQHTQKECTTKCIDIYSAYELNKCTSVVPLFVTRFDRLLCNMHVPTAASILFVRLQRNNKKNADRVEAICKELSTFQWLSSLAWEKQIKYFDLDTRRIHRLYPRWHFSAQKFQIRENKYVRRWFVLIWMAARVCANRS